MLARAIAVMLISATLSGAYLVREGAVRLAVDDRDTGGRHVRLFLPAALIPLGMKIVPEHLFHGAVEQVQPWLPAVRVASKELARLPDTDLLEVRGPGHHVSIAKRGARLVIDVLDPRQTIHLSFPLKTAERLARQLESVGPGG